MSEYSSQEISEAARAAIENWDFDQVDNGDKQIVALEHLAQNPQEIETSWDVFDFLAEYASATAADMK